MVEEVWWRRCGGARAPMVEGMVGSLGRAPGERQAQGQCQAPGSSCLQMGPKVCAGREEVGSARW